MRRIIIVVVLALIGAACGSDVAETPDSSEAAQTTVTQTAPATTVPPTTTPPTTVPAATTTEAAQESGDDPLSQAARQSADAQSGRFEATMEITSAELGGETGIVPISGEFADGRYSMTMDMTSLLAASGEVPPELATQFGELQYIVDGDTVYMKFGLMAMLGAQTEWVSMPVDQADQTAGFGASGPASPTSPLEDFAAAGAEVTEVGPETVRGVDTTQYLVEFDAEDLEALEDTTSQSFAEQGIEMLPVNFWIGDDGFIYRYQLTIDESVTGDATGDTLLLTYEIFDYGADIAIELPDPADVSDFSDLTPVLPTVPASG